MGGENLARSPNPKAKFKEQKPVPLRRQKTLQNYVYAILSEDLMKGRFLPGDTVSLRNVALRLGTSPMPVRAAINRLIAEHALVLQPNRTIIVPWMTRHRFVDLFNTRRALEGRLSEMACACGTPKLRSSLTKLNNEIKKKLRLDRIAEVLNLNYDFHMALYRHASAEVSFPFVQMLWRQAGPFVAITPRLPGFSWTARFHDELLMALAKHDPPAARIAIEKDVSESMDQLLAHAKFDPE